VTNKIKLEVLHLQSVGQKW